MTGACCTEGRCSFEVAVPHTLFDGEKHKLSVRAPEAGTDALASTEVTLPMAAGKTRERPVP
jgi:hypothetical protein